jgi:hypothetical protein
MIQEFEIDAGMVARFNTRNYALSDPCIICGITFNKCPHSIDDCARVIMDIRKLGNARRQQILKGVK